MRFLLAITVLVFISFPAYAFKEAGSAQYGACQTDSDCIIVDNVCPNSWSGIHKDYKEWHENQNKKMVPLVECAAPDPKITRPLRVVCKDYYCRIPDQEFQREPIPDEAP